MKKLLFVLIIFLVAAAAGLRSPAAAGSLRQSAQDGQALFQQKCAACHTVGGGKLVGPNLQGVTQRRDLTWIRSFISAPDTVIASGDPTAQKLLAENNNVVMPNLGLNDADVTALLAYLENPAGANAAPSAAPALPAGDAGLGRSLFTGVTRLNAGGPACIACHSVDGIGALGGGSLGPDLTHVLQRYGEAGLAANLSQISFPTMLGPFKGRPLSPQEQADLLAYFRESDAQPVSAAPQPARTLFFGIGGGLALLLFAVMLVFRPQRAASPLDRLHRKQ